MQHPSWGRGNWPKAMGKCTSLMSEIWQRLDAIGVVCGAITCKKVITLCEVRINMPGAALVVAYTMNGSDAPPARTVYKITWSRYVTLDSLVSWPVLAGGRLTHWCYPLVGALLPSSTSRFACLPDASPSATPRLSEIALKSVAPVVTVGAMSVIAVGETVWMIIVKAITKLWKEHTAARLGWAVQGSAVPGWGELS